jgi:hypothetical protein
MVFQGFQRYDRKTFSVRAIRVTEENIERVAMDVSMDLVRIDPPNWGHEKFFYLRNQSGNPQTCPLVFVGDWVTVVDGQFKRYTDKDFRATFNVGE